DLLEDAVALDAANVVAVVAAALVRDAGARGGEGRGDQRLAADQVAEVGGGEIPEVDRGDGAGRFVDGTLRARGGDNDFVEPNRRDGGVGGVGERDGGQREEARCQGGGFHFVQLTAQAS